METWKPLHNFPGYEGSSEGRIKNIRTQYILHPKPDHRGCLKVGLYKRGKRHSVKVRRIMAKTFLGDHPGMDVRHKDGDQTNVAVNNLEWCSRSELIREAYDRGSKTPANQYLLKGI